jgi:RelA/SpoT family (p)ppGpp synthetase
MPISIPIPTTLRRRRPASAAERARPLLAADPKTAGALTDRLRAYLDDAAIAEVYRAYLFSAQAHDGQRRISGEPYVYHPVAVATILAELHLDYRAIIAALLHDVLEDTRFTKQQLVVDFGREVADLVDGVTKIGKLEFANPEQAEAENFRKMLLAMSQDIRVILVKLADRLHNLRTLDALPPAKRRTIARQTLEIYAPIANRLGLHDWYRELEDLSFAHLHPLRHRAVSGAVAKAEGGHKKALRRQRDDIEKALSQAGIRATVEARHKSAWSVYRKMRAKHCKIEQMDDLYGFRIIVGGVEDCYRALGVVHRLYKPFVERFKDHIAIPKNNGYQSLHTTVCGVHGGMVEVQIRTEDMHRVAQAGVAAHWIYKQGGTASAGPASLARQWLLDLLDTQSQTGSPREFLEHLKIDLHPDEVYVFTPRGDIKKLPRGATALDFAYSVHSDVGNRCAGARVNQQLVPLATVLASGDRVEILTADTARPTPAWLKYTVTSKARAAIRSHLRSLQRDNAVKLGKRLLKQSLRLGRFSRMKIGDEKQRRLLDTLRVGSWEDLLASIGLGERLPQLVAHQLELAEGGGTAGPQASAALTLSGTEGMLVNYARCCRPIPGDPVVGFFTAGRGMVVHVDDCRNARDIRRSADQGISLEWAPDVQGDFAVNLRVDVENRRGVLARVATAIAEMESNIDNVGVEEHDERHSTIRFVIEVKNRTHLARILRRVRLEPQVMRVARTKT